MLLVFYRSIFGVLNSLQSRRHTLGHSQVFRSGPRKKALERGISGCANSRTQTRSPNMIRGLFTTVCTQQSFRTISATNGSFSNIQLHSANWFLRLFCPWRGYVCLWKSTTGIYSVGNLACIWSVVCISGDA